MQIVKNLAFGDEARKSLISGVNKLADAVKSTLGARGKTVLIESGGIGGVAITKDGVSVANSITLADPTENLAVNVVRQAASLTASQAGDGTTSTIVLAQSLVIEANERIKPAMNQTEIIRHLRIAGDEVLKRLDECAKPITEKNLCDVATISANGDRKLGEMIADAYSKVSAVTVERSKTHNTYSEITNGFRIARGWLSKYFITNVVKQECVLVKPYILVCDKTIENFRSIMHLAEYAKANKRPLLIIGDLSEETLATLNYNMNQGIMQFCAIQRPDISFKGAEMMEDIAIATGATFWSEGSGDNFELIHTDYLGSAEKIIVGVSNTTIVLGDSVTDETLLRTQGRIEELEQKVNEATDPLDKAYLKERLSNLKGGIGVLYVGAVSEIERGELKDRVDDAVSAVSAAIDQGIVYGGGVALLQISEEMVYGDDESGRVAWHILKEALQSPYKQILKNGGFEPVKLSKGKGFDVAKGQLVDMENSGIVDPLKVVKCSLENALSVACTIISTDCIVTNVRA